MPFEDKTVDAVMAKYQGLDRQALVDCAEAIKTKLGEDAEKHGDLKILSKAATKLMGAKARTEQVEQSAEKEAEAEEQESESVSLAVAGDYVPASVVEAGEYITAANTIDPKRDFYKGVQGQTLTKTGLDKLARCAQINTEVVDVQVTDGMILAKVRGWIGPRDNPVLETMDVADYSMRDKSTEFVIEKLNKGQVKAEEIVEEDDCLRFVNPVYNIRMKAFLTKEREFALRATVSKAENRVKRKLLGLNSMDLKEAQMLKDEFERVNGKVQRRMN